MKNASYFRGLVLSLISVIAPQLQAQETPKEPPSQPSQANCPQRAWIEGEYLYSWIKDSPAPVGLVTEGQVIPTFEPFVIINPLPLILGTSETNVILGGKKIDNGGRSGFKVGTGYRFGTGEFFGLDSSYTYLGNHSHTKSVGNDGQFGTHLLGIPFFDVTDSEETFSPLTEPGDFSGKAVLKVSNFMQDADINGSFRIFQQCRPFDLQAFAGFLWWNFNEHATFCTNNLNVTAPIGIFKTKDQFQTHNNFYGGQLGLRGEYLYKHWSFQLRGQVALGAMHSELHIRGRLLTNQFSDFVGPAETFPAGYFALPSNEGHSSRTHFSVIPQANAKVGYNVAKWLNLNVGYNFLYATRVMWASNQFDHAINPTQAPAISFAPSVALVGEAAPKALHKTSSFWAQSVTVGMRFEF